MPRLYQLAIKRSDAKNAQALFLCALSVLTLSNVICFSVVLTQEKRSLCLYYRSMESGQIKKYFFQLIYAILLQDRNDT